MEKHVCPWWLAYTFDNPLRRLLHDPGKIFSPYVKPGMTAIDVGCGMGYFSIAMARIVGDTGKVIAVDVQQKMLDILMKRATRLGVEKRIATVLCDAENIGVNQQVDFALMFWMVHEAPDEAAILRQAYQILKPSCKLLYAEPKIHVSQKEFNRILAVAQQQGFRLIASPSICCSYAAVFEK